LGGLAVKIISYGECDIGLRQNNKILDGINNNSEIMLSALRRTV
jgi:hypothetical protein